MRRSIGLTGAWLVFGFYALHSALPTNPAVSLFSELEVPFGQQVEPWMRALVPEGWAMFTIPPAAPRITLYRRNSDGTWISASLGPFAEPKNGFGLSRSPRSRLAEVARLASLVPANAWQECRATTVDCLNGSPIIKARNPNFAASLCGEIGLVRAPPRRPDWMASPRSSEPISVARLVVAC